MKFSRENFRGTLRLQHLSNAIIRSLYNIHGKTFAVLLKPAKNAKVKPSESFPIYGKSTVLNVIFMPSQSKLTDMLYY